MRGDAVKRPAVRGQRPDGQKSEKPGRKFVRKIPVGIREDDEGGYIPAYDDRGKGIRS